MSRKKSHDLSLLFALAVLASAATARAGGQGDVWIANAFTSGNQYVSAISSCASGSSVLLWSDDARRDGLFMRRYSAAGAPLDPGERLVDPAGAPTTGAGCFATTSTAPDGSGNGVYVSIYDPSGNVVVPRFRVNEATLGEQKTARVAISASGRFAVAWADATSKSVHVKLFRPDGTAVAPAQVAFRSAKQIGDVRVAINSRGAAVVAWNAIVAWPSNVDVYFRRYSATGFAAAPAAMADTTASGLQLVHGLAMNTAGALVLVWESLSAPGPSSTWAIKGRRVRADGGSPGGEFQINSETSICEPAPSMAMAGNGSFTVAWTDCRQPSGHGQVLARSYRSNATALGLPFVVSADSSLEHQAPLVASDGDGNTTVAWRQYDPATNHTDVAVRRYPFSEISAQAVAGGAASASPSGATGRWQSFQVQPQGSPGDSGQP